MNNYGNTIFKSEMYIDQDFLRHRNDNYTIFNIIGDIGGVLELLIMIFGILIYPINQNSFYIEAID